MSVLFHLQAVFSLFSLDCLGKCKFQQKAVACLVLSSGNSGRLDSRKINVRDSVSGPYDKV